MDYQKYIRKMCIRDSRIAEENGIADMTLDEINAEIAEARKQGDDIVHDVLESIEKRGIFLDAESIDVELPDPKDRVFYEVVIEGRKSEESYLVTGNIKHFPERTFIVTPREMMEIILSDER